MMSRWADWFFQHFGWPGVIAAVVIVALIVYLLVSWWQERQ
jgi:hypothetical protein